MKGIFKSFLVLLLLVICSSQLKAHTVDYYTTCGYICNGSTITIDASISAAGSGTYYNWQYRDNSGIWKCFVNGSNTINGVAFTVSGALATGPANNAPLLTIQAATIALENVEVRVLMADNGSPCGTPSYSVWGGDTDPNNYYKSLRLHVLSGVDCSTISSNCSMGGCNGNLLSDANGYYGGFESTNNWSGASTNYINGGSSAGQYSILNNVRNAQSSFPAFAPKSGNSMMYVDGSTSSTARVWFKTVALTAGNTYQFSAWIANANNSSTNLSSIVLKVNGVAVDTSTVTATAGNWVFAQGDYNATVTGNVTLEIFNLNLQSGNNDFVIDDICFKSLGTTVTTNCGAGYFNPLADAVGLNVCVKNNTTFQNCHTDGPVGMGGDGTLNGTCNISMTSKGTYPFGRDIDENYGLIVGGKLNYVSGSQSTVNSGYCRIKNSTGSSFFYNDCNNAVSNFRSTNYNSNCTTAYNSYPQLASQKIHPTGCVSDDHDIDFTITFTALQDYANKMAQYTASSSCASNLNIITLGSGAQTITLASNKINVINLTSSQLASITSLTFANRPASTRPLIFNVNGTASFTWPSFNMASIQNTDGAFVIFNFYNNTGTITLTGASTIVGSIFAPGATFIKNHTGNTEGQIVAANCTLVGGEVHYQPFNVCLPECTSSTSTTSCTGNLLTNASGYYGGFELGKASISSTAGTTDLRYGLPANATYEIVKTPSNGCGGGGYISMQPKSGSYFMIAHTPSNSSRIWYKNVTVTPGATYQFCAWIANGKANPSSGFTVNLYANGSSIASGTAGSTWSQLCGSYTVPTGVNSIEIAVRDLTPTSGNYSHFLYLDDICFVLTSNPLSLGDFVWNDLNNNGIQDAGEPGISGVTVKLYADANSDGVPDGAALATTTTSASGIYSFTGLTPNGKYVVGVTVPTGYSPGATTATSADPNNATADDDNGINLVSGEVRSGTITLASTNNRVDFGFSNCTKSSEGFPNQYNTGFAKPITNGTFTGHTGTFTVNTSANATIVVTQPYYSPSAFNAIKIVNWATNGSQPETPTAGVGTTSTVSPQINLTNICCPAELTLQYTLWTYTVNSLDNNTIFAWDFSNDNGITWNQMVSTTPAALNTSYGANGKVTLSIPVPLMYQNANFRYRIRSSKPINNAYNFYVFIDDIILSSPTTCAATVNLGNQVWLDVNNNGIKDAGEPGISGITTNLYLDINGDNAPDGAAIATTTTNASGNYNFSGLPAGKYIVGVVMPTGYSASATTTNSSNPNTDIDNDNNGVNLVGSELRSNSITLSVGGEPASGVDGDGTSGNLTLDFGLRGSLNLGNLVWNDTNGNGIKNTFESGVAGVTVYLYQDANADNIPDGAAIATTTTATGGIYGFSNLAPGNYIVGIVTPTGYAKSFTPVSGSTVNNNTDNDNNGVVETAGIIYSKYNTLSIGGEPDVAVDGDGTNGNLTLDFAIAKDTDGDKIPDVIDIDDDNDGITDLNESGGYDPLGDCDGDGIPNYLDSTPGCSTPSGNDPWGKPYQPLTWSDCNMDGVNDFFDWDRDGIINELDLDSDNDGILDVQEARPNGVAVTSTLNGMITGTDADGNGLLSSYENGNTNPVLNGIAAQDFDRDGTPNFLDLDSDGDGITDLTEALGTYSTTGVVSGTDTDGDGVRAESFGSSAAATADNINGFGAKGITLLDSDNDGKPNAYDIDSDNDGITDNAEGQATCSNKLPSGNDCDGDGVDDVYDAGGCSSCLRTSGGITPFDKDGDGTPDYLDLDTDNDGALDIYEGHSIPSTNGNVPPANYWIAQIGDADKDGLLDYFDGLNILTATGGNYWRNVINNNMGNNGGWDTGTGATGSITQLPKSQVSSDCSVGDRDWRNITILPASLVEFKGNLNNNTVNVTWTVTKEANLSHYEVERSINGTVFTKVTSVQAANAGVATVSYNATDDISALTTAAVYYRIKIVEKDGSFKHSNIISFKLGNKKAGIVVNPNPATSYFTLKITNAKEAVAVVKVIDMMGKALITQTSKVMAGVNTYTFNNLSNFSAGTYSVQVMIDNQLYTEKLIVVKY